MNNELTIVKKETINGIECDFYRDKNGDIWLTRQQMGEMLEYAEPMKAIANIHERNKPRMDKFSVFLKMRNAADGKEYKTYFYNEQGIYEILMKSNQPKANDARDKIYIVLKALRKGEIKLSGSDSKPVLDSETKRKIADARNRNSKTRAAKLLMQMSEKFKSQIGLTSFQAMISEAANIMCGRPLIALPVMKSPLYGAGDIAKELAKEGIEISANMIGRISNKLGLKGVEPKEGENRVTPYGEWIMSKSRYSTRQVHTFEYNDHGKNKVIGYIRSNYAGGENEQPELFEMGA